MRQALNPQLTRIGSVNKMDSHQLGWGNIWNGASPPRTKGMARVSRMLAVSSSHHDFFSRLGQNCEDSGSIGCSRLAIPGRRLSMS